MPSFPRIPFFWVDQHGSATTTRQTYFTDFYSIGRMISFQYFSHGSDSLMKKYVYRYLYMILIISILIMMVFSYLILLFDDEFPRTEAGSFDAVGSNLLVCWTCRVRQARWWSLIIAKIWCLMVLHYWSECLWNYMKLWLTMKERGSGDDLWITFWTIGKHRV